MKIMGISAPSLTRKKPATGTTRAENLKTGRTCAPQPTSKAKVTLARVPILEKSIAVDCGA